MSTRHSIVPTSRVFLEALPIASQLDHIWCSRKATSHAEAMGFTRGDQWKIAIAVRELVTNVLKFAGTGTFELYRIDEPQVGLEIVVEDNGPGIPDIEQAIIDGYSEGYYIPEGRPLHLPRRGIGAGLGAITRLMDRLELINKPSGGLRAVTRKWLVG